jgi:hypothetical protein
LQPYPVLPAAARITGSPTACCRRAPYAVPEPSLRALGSLGRKPATAHLLSRDAHPLQRAEVRGYDFNRMVVEFTMLNESKANRPVVLRSIDFF